MADFDVRELHKKIEDKTDAILREIAHLKYTVFVVAAVLIVVFVLGARIF